MLWRPRPSRLLDPTQLFALHHYSEAKTCDFIEIVSILPSNSQNAAGHVPPGGVVVWQHRCHVRCFAVVMLDQSAGYHKKLWTDSDEILCTGWVCDKNEPIRF